MIRVGIDAHGLGGHSLGLGNESYFKYLIKGLVEIDDCNEYHIFVNHPKELATIVAVGPAAVQPAPLCNPAPVGRAALPVHPAAVGLRAHDRHGPRRVLRGIPAAFPAA